MSDSGLSTFLDAISALPAYNGISFRGLEAGAQEPPPLGVAAGVLATSRDLRVATENLAAPVTLVLLHRTGRDISAFSEYPAEAEVVVRPGSAWQRLTELDPPAGVGRLLVLEELDLSGTTPAPVTWGDTLAELASRVTELVSRSVAASPVPVSSPGKYVGPWPAQVPTGR